MKKPTEKLSRSILKDQSRKAFKKPYQPFPKQAKAVIF